MMNLLLQRMTPLLVVIAMAVNSIGGMLGFGQIIPYNPERTDVVVSGDVSTDIDKIVETYNAALEKTGFVIGTTSNEFVDEPVIESESNNEYTEIFMDSFVAAYNNTTANIFNVPGSGIQSFDVKSAKMSSENGNTNIIINIKDFTGDVNDVDNGVARALGFASSSIFEEGDMTVSYTDCVIACVINEKTGKIVYADLDYKGETKCRDIEYIFGDIVIVIDKMEFTLVSHVDI